MTKQRFHLLALICGLLIFYTHEGQPAHLIISPSNICLDGGNKVSEVTFNCTSDVGGVSALIGMEFGKILPNGAKDSWNKVAFNVTGPTVGPGDSTGDGFASRRKYNFYLQRDEGYMANVLEYIRCSDAGTYYCVTTHLTGDGTSAKLRDETTTELQACSGCPTGAAGTAALTFKGFVVNIAMVLLMTTWKAI